MVPAQQRLEPADAARIQLHERLEINLQFAPAERLAQVDLQRPACAHAVFHGGVEELVGAAAFGLDEIQRDIGAAQQVVQILAAIGWQRHANAGRNAQMVAVHFVEFGQFVDDEARQ